MNQNFNAEVKIVIVAHKDATWECLLGGLHVTNPPIRLMCPSVRQHFCFLDSNSKTLCPIEFKLDREIDHHHSYVAFEIGVIPSVGPFFVHLSVRQNFCFQTLTRKRFVQSNSDLVGR